MITTLESVCECPSYDQMQVQLNDDDDDGYANDDDDDDGVFNSLILIFSDFPF